MLCCLVDALLPAEELVYLDHFALVVGHCRVGCSHISPHHVLLAQLGWHVARVA